MSQPDFYAILDQCVSRLRRGESPQACLADYPGHAAELAPDLALTAELLQLSPLEPSPAAVADGYQKMMAVLDEQGKASPLAGLSAFAGDLLAPLRRQPRGLTFGALRITVIVAVIMVVAGGLVINAAASTLPGDTLYSVKRSWENARLTLTADDSSRQALRSEFDRRRREEVQAVMDLRRPVVVEFTGELETMANEVWQVAGLDLIITGDTQVTGLVAIGQSVTVRAQVEDDGSLLALRIVVDRSGPLPVASPTFTPRPTQTPPPTRSAVTPQSGVATRSEAPASPTPTPEKTRPEATATEKPADRATRKATPTPTPAVNIRPSVDSAPTPTRTPQPTSTRPSDSLATSAPRPTPTPTPVKNDPTPTSRPSDKATPTPTPTQRTDQNLQPTREPTATRNTDTGELYDRPP